MSKFVYPNPYSHFYTAFWYPRHLINLSLLNLQLVLRAEATIHSVCLLGTNLRSLKIKLPAKGRMVYCPCLWVPVLLVFMHKAKRIIY